MSEYINPNAVEVKGGAGVPLTGRVGCNTCQTIHREDSSQVTLKSKSNAVGRFSVWYSGNIAVPDGGTVGAISIAIAINGEPLASATAIITPAETEEYGNVATNVYVLVPCGCCVTVSLVNTSDQTILAANTSLIIEQI